MWPVGHQFSRRDSPTRTRLGVVILRLSQSPSPTLGICPKYAPPIAAIRAGVKSTYNADNPPSLSGISRNCGQMVIILRVRVSYQPPAKYGHS